MRTPHATPVRFVAPTVPLLDASFLPAEEDWVVLEALQGHGDAFDTDDDRLAGLGLSAGNFD